MPLVRYACSCGYAQNKMVLPREVKDLPPSYLCGGCGKSGGLQRQLGGPASVSKVRVDNGLQSKAVEIVPAIIDKRYGKE